MIFAFVQMKIRILKACLFRIKFLALVLIPGLLSLL
mgnify:CR=1 FL=1